MAPRRIPNFVVVGLMCLATIGAFAPHIGMLALRAAGIHPPAALAYFCILDHSHANGSKARVSAGWSLPGVRPFR